MLPFLITVSAALLLILILFLILAHYAYRKAFYSDRSKVRDPYKGIDKRGYKPYTERIRGLIDSISAEPCETVYITARDGTPLAARYYHRRNGAPLHIQCHGYKGNPLRDCAGSATECLAGGDNLLMIYQRAGGESGGKTITFGIKERLDLLDWIKYSIERFGAETKIVLYGVSMGAATVLMAAGEQLPPNVKGVIADCPYSTPVDIIVKVASESGMPKFLIKPLAIAGARIYGGFSLRETDSVSAVRRATLPILLLHGEADSFVPIYMSDEIFSANPSIIYKKFPGAEHATSYLTDTEGYISAVNGFLSEVLDDEHKDEEKR